MRNAQRFLVLAVVVLVYTGILHAQYNPYIEDFRRWMSWECQVPTLDFQIDVNGLYARSIMTIEFKDIYSNAEADSMEVIFNFSLPEQSVVDSMYLWINDQPQPAALKERWSATQTYTEITGRRMDPALLTKSYGDSYNLRVFPFSRGQQRKVRICYTTPLQPMGDKLVLKVPTAIAASAADVVNSMAVSVTAHNLRQDDISVINGDLFEQNISLHNATSAQITCVGRHIKPVSTLQIAFYNEQLANSGIALSFGPDKAGDMCFAAVVDAERAFDVQLAAKRNVFIVWNMVTHYSYHYEDEYNSGYNNEDTIYNAYNIEYETSALVEFVSKNLRAGDRFNLCVNAQKPLILYQGLKEWSPSMAQEISAYLKSQLQTVTTNSGCTHPMDFLEDMLATVASEQELSMIFLNNYYSYQFPFDSTKWTEKQAAISALVPEDARVFGVCDYYYSYDFVSMTIANLAKTHKGMLYGSYGDRSEIYNSINKTLSTRITAGNLSFTCNNNAYTYSVLAPNSNQYYLGMPILAMGKIHGNPSRLKVDFYGEIAERTYHSDETFVPASGTANNYDISKLWAGRQAENLTWSLDRTYALAEFSEALQVALDYRVLTMETALLALEPGVFAEELYIDDQSQGGGGETSIRENASRRPAFAAFSLNIRQTGKSVRLNISFDIKNAEHQDCALRIYDIKGRLIADLSKQIKRNSGTQAIDWAAKGIANGMYIVRFTLGKNIAQKAIKFAR